ncbi:MAG: 2,3-bisphosphoglycerate-independent phosphoglycerate mutase [Candidatus Cloacimonetes bacterium]|nr:2,3-bisphosphoglycerate-independent phosphoglycerate mutase [Candidatus Cloacimonadota bacterium]MBS3767182.1 2,3-bisphosphoglycerate-independent phosphoglycerate mutase [Candidatus Cloacimonadota bacterium]
MDKRKVMLIIMDGYGLREEDKGNAIHAASTPNLDKLFKKIPNTKLECSGEAVGLPEGVMGNSEVGHLNLGSGKIVYQAVTRINKAISDGSFFENEELLKAVNNCKENDSALHIFGLVSDGLVHSSLEHLWSLLKLAKKHNLHKVYLHAFMDGRDTPPHSGIDYIKQTKRKLQDIGVGKIATISGRYYAMDRDNRWDRIQKAYRAIVHGVGNKGDNPVAIMQASYDNNVTDEFVIPTVVENKEEPVATVNDGDSIIFFNFRADRARQITSSFVVPDFDKFGVKNFSELVFTTMTEYDAKLNPYVNVAYEPLEHKNLLGEILSKKDLKQLRIAETEKYAHVTFFFNGGNETPFEDEDRILINSPKVSTYDKQPEMSAFLVRDRVIEEIKKGKYDVIIMNLANCDMVGHTGDFDAAVKAVEAVDNSVGEVIPVLEKQGYDYIITADHGNAEQMYEADESAMTAHTTNLVPCLISLRNAKDVKLRDNGILADISPTILDILNIKQPDEMTGKSLIKD